MSKIKYFVFVFLTFFLYLGISNAASISVTSTAKSVVVGNTFSVKVAVNGSDAFGWEYCVNYDSSVLSLVSATSDTGSKCVKTGSDMTGGRNVTFKFKAIKSGSSTVSLTGVNVYNESLATISATRGSVTIIARTQAEIEASYSDNANLSSLGVSGYTLSPEFNKNTLEYNLEVENEVENITIVAKKADSSASINGVGEKKLSEGTNKFTIVVTAQKGNTKKYVINITRKELNPINVNVDGKAYTIVRKVESLEAPNLYTATNITIDDESVPAFKNEINKLTLVGLKDEEGNISLYIYDEQTESYELYKQITGSSIIIVPIENTEKLDGYKNKNLTISETEVSVLYKDKSEIVLIYGMNVATGEKAWYQYDSVEGTFQKYYEEVVSEEENNGFENKKIFILLLILTVALGLSLLVIILLIVLYLRAKKKNSKLISILEERRYKEQVSKINKEQDMHGELEEVINDDVVSSSSEKSAEEKKEVVDNVTDETIENNIIDNDTIELEFDKGGMALAEQTILNNIAKANDKNFDENKDIKVAKEKDNNLVEKIEVEIKEIEPSLTKSELKKLEKQKRKENKKAVKKAKREFLDDVDYDDSAFDKYIREDTEIIPVVTEELTEKNDKIIKKKR